MCAVKIAALEAENVKRIRAVALEPSPSGLTVIGGNNNQGKTSILDTIAWALGGDRYRPSNPTRDGSTIPPRIKITLSNGLIVERAGKNSALKVTDPNPECGFVLLDKLEQMDLQTMQTFGQWLETQNLQAIATRVSTGSECTIIIEDGHVAGEVLPEIPAANSGWKAGVF